MIGLFSFLFTTRKVFKGSSERIWFCHNQNKKQIVVSLIGKFNVCFYPLLIMIRIDQSHPSIVPCKDVAGATRQAFQVSVYCLCHKKRRTTSRCMNNT